MCICILCVCVSRVEDIRTKVDLIRQSGEAIQLCASLLYIRRIRARMKETAPCEESDGIGEGVNKYLYHRNISDYNFGLKMSV